GRAWAENAFRPQGALRGKPFEKSGALSGHPTPDTAVWGHSPDVPVWRVVAASREKGPGPWCYPLRPYKGVRRTPRGNYVLVDRPDSHMAVFSSLFFSRSGVPLKVVSSRCPRPRRPAGAARTDPAGDPALIELKARNDT